ncbi:phage baseplate assembly protein V [Vibrio fluvialis]|uniref:phage baseplate assembly protein V n=1 Tax=Vibrio fluvialis TaxID=676 RepID=UPI0023A9F2C7|nr:phage baseplate assembly protein V [Vibrio fluvialis]MDE5179944.1 phage baseplate assembly protein V [Vibrio fluvialis]
MAQSLEERVSELERKFAQSYVRGKVSDIDPPNWCVKVSYGTDEKPMSTKWLPVKPMRSGQAIVWWFPEVGEGVTVLSPGDLRLGEVFPGSYHNDRPPPTTNPDEFYIAFGDGSKVVHNRESSKLDVVNVGDVEVTTQQNLTINTTGIVKINSEAKDIRLNEGAGVVTGAHICQLTGKPHSDCSVQVKAGK